MSAWKWMSAAARTQAVKDSRNRTAAHIAAHYGAPLQSVQAIIDRLGSNTDEGQPGPPERPACEGTPTPAAAEHAPGDGGPDGGSSTVAGATSDGGGEGVTSAADAAAAAPAMARSSPPPQIKRQKLARPMREAATPKLIFASEKRAKTVVPAQERRMAGPLPKKRPKVMAKAGELKPEPKAEMSADEFAVTIYLPRSVLRTLQERAEKPRWTRAQMAAAMVIQACNKE